MKSKNLKRYTLSTRPEGSRDLWEGNLAVNGTTPLEAVKRLPGFKKVECAGGSHRFKVIDHTGRELDVILVEQQ